MIFIVIFRVFYSPIIVSLSVIINQKHIKIAVLKYPLASDVCFPPRVAGSSKGMDEILRRSHKLGKERFISTSHKKISIKDPPRVVITDVP